MIAPLSQPAAYSPLRGNSITEQPPFNAASLSPPLLAHSIELCRRYGIPDHHAEDFLQEMWLRSFTRATAIWDQDPESGRIRTYVYLRRRLLGCFQDQQRGRLRHLVGRPSDDAMTFDQLEEV